MQIKIWKEQRIKFGVSFTGAIKLGLFTPYLSKAIKKKVRKGGAPIRSATCYTIGHKKKGTDGKWYKVIKIGNSRRWSKC